MSFWKQAIQSDLVATNRRRIWLAANGSNQAKASAWKDAISVRSSLMPREPSSSGIPRAPARSALGLSRSRVRPGARARAAKAFRSGLRCCLAARLQSWPSTCLIRPAPTGLLIHQELTGLSCRGLGPPAPVAMARPSLQHRYDEHLDGTTARPRPP